jgi:hypothetical protein
MIEPPLALVIIPKKSKRAIFSEHEASSSSCIFQLVERDCIPSSDNDIDYEFYDGDSNVEGGDDDLFSDNVDKSIHDRMRKKFVREMNMRMPLRIMI